MKFFKKESFIKKGIIVIVIVLLTNFSFPTMSRAADVTEAITDFLLALPDGVFYMLQSTFLDAGDVRIKVKSKRKAKDEKITWGQIPLIIRGIPVVNSLANVGVGIYNLFIADGEFNLPNIKYTPYAIFANEIPLLNADFFSKEDNEFGYIYPGYSDPDGSGVQIEPISIKLKSEEDAKSEIREYIEEALQKANLKDNDDQVEEYISKLIMTYAESKTEENKQKLNDELTKFIEQGTLTFKETYHYDGGLVSDYIDSFADYNDVFMAFGSPSSSDQNIYDGFAVNLEKGIPKDVDFEGIEVSEDMLESQMNRIEKVEVQSSVFVLKPIVSKWYNILRIVAMVGLLSVLVYIGIRILVYSTSAQDKAKYKTMLKDWLVGLCLLFVLHFIMSFTMAVTRYIIDVFGNSEIESIPLSIHSDTKFIDDDAKSMLDYKEHIYEEDGRTYWNCNAVERVRFPISAIEEEDDDDKVQLRLGYGILYIVITIEVLIFTFQYLKRVITMAMLTLIAPLVALTYPIDKITDGQAQGFNMWLKEYIFNALLQPMHLILYTIIMSSALVLISTNVIYSVVALGCMTPMEKLLRKIFGFSKAESVGAFGGAAGAAVVMSTIGSLQKLGKRSPIGKGREKEDGIKLWDNKKSIDAEGTLLGAPEEREGVLDKFNNKEDNSVSNTGLGTQQKDKSNKVSQKKILLPDDLDRDPTRKILLPDSVDRTNIGKNTKPKMKDVQNPTPIRNMATTNKRTSMPKRTIKNPRLHALGQVGKSYGRKLTRTLTPGNVLKGATTVAGGVALGTVGLAAGIASGDFGKAVQYTTTAGVAGATLGSSLAGRGTNIVEDSIDTYQTAYASADEDYATDRRIKEFKKNEQNMKYLESRYTNRKEREEVIKTMEATAEYGITNVQDVSAIYEMRKQEGLDMSQAIAVAKMYKQVGDISEPKARKEWQEHFESKGYSNIQVKQLLNRLEKFKKERD